MNALVMGLVAAADDSTLQASWDSGLALALAGGVGAFLGAVLGQFVQWARDVWLARKEDERRHEDADREATAARRAVRLEDYREVLAFLHSLREDLRSVSTGAFVSQGGDDLMLSEAWGKLRDKSLTSLSDARARVDIVGSAALRDTFERLSLLCAAFVTDVLALSRTTWPPEAEVRTALERGEPLTNLLVEVTITPTERADEVSRIVGSVEELVDEARTIIRQELDLHD